MVSTCNYEARKYGIHSAMSSKEALDLCPQAIFISGNYEKYREVGEQVREIFKRYNYAEVRTPIFEHYEVISALSEIQRIS